MKRSFYRVCNPDTQQGLWYKFDGTFSGLIHEEFDFCFNSQLKMDYDEELVGWLSVADDLDHLWGWFTTEDVANLQKHGWFIYEYEATEWKFYEKFQHNVISQATSKLVRKIELFQIGCHDCKFEQWVYNDDLFVRCPSCSPHHPKFHYKK